MINPGHVATSCYKSRMNILTIQQYYRTKKLCDKLVEQTPDDKSYV